MTVAVCATVTAVAAAQPRLATTSTVAGVAAATARTITAVPVDAVPIRVDGDLADAIWRTAPMVGGFLQREPDEGAPTTHATEVRVAYDRDALYVAIRAIDPEPVQLVGLLPRRDGVSPSDWLSILIDSFDDNRTAYEFGVNMSGVKYDRYWYNDTNNDQGWDAVWDVATRRTETGWQAEFRIGFSQLRFRAGEPGPMGFATMRTVAHLDETSTWPLLARSASGFVSSFGELQGVVVGAGQKTLEIVPYALGQGSTRPVAEGHPFVSSPSASMAA